MTRPARDRPLWIVCEDGTEYTERFERFLGGEFCFVRTDDLPTLLEAAAGEAVGLLLDLDFHRNAGGRLVGAGDPATRVSEQGLLLLQELRARAIHLPALLFADLDDPGRKRSLEARLAPLTVVGSSEGLAETAKRMREIAGESPRSGNRLPPA